MFKTQISQCKCVFDDNKFREAVADWKANNQPICAHGFRMSKAYYSKMAKKQTYFNLYKGRV